MPGLPAVFTVSAHSGLCQHCKTVADRWGPPAFQLRVLEVKMLARQLVQRWEQGWAGAQSVTSLPALHRLSTTHASFCFLSMSSPLSSDHPNSRGPTVTGALGTAFEV